MLLLCVLILAFQSLVSLAVLALERPLFWVRYTNYLLSVAALLLCVLQLAVPQNVLRSLQELRLLLYIDSYATLCLTIPYLTMQSQESHFTIVKGHSSPQ